MGGLVDMVTPTVVGCQALPSAKAGSQWLVRPGHKADGCRNQGFPRANPGSLVSSRVCACGAGTPDLVSTC